MATMRMADVVIIAEGRHPRIKWPHESNTSINATKFLVSRMFTDAIFNGDIRVIQTIVNRIDGGLPKDVDIEEARTLFGDCVNCILESPIDERIKVHPDDSVLMAMAKALYAEAVKDIYWNHELNKPVKKPTTEDKQSRDAALRMILERSQGRRTITSKEKQLENIEVAGWIKSLKDGSDTVV